MSTMRFATEGDKDRYFHACKDKCKVDAEQEEKVTKERLNELDIICAAEYVDCSNNGGYDPRDFCKQTCKIPLEGRDHTDADTVQEEVGKFTSFVVFKGEMIDVKCNEDQICTEPDGTVVELLSKSEKELLQVTFKKSPPKGGEWRYDCSNLEKILDDNCWSNAIRVASGFAGALSMAYMSM